MPTLHDLLPDAKTLAELEPHELAGLSLELILNGGPFAPSRLHPTGFTNPDTIGLFPQEQRAELQHLMAEGWSWLVNEGLLAPIPGDTSGWHFVTRRGKKLKNRQGLQAYVASVTLPRALLHPAITQACWSAYLRGEYDTAVFQAFRELEIAVRDAAGFTADDYGAYLMRRAFAENKGPLADKSSPISEQAALAHLMAGAVGSYKNPHSHRHVAVGVEEACEMILLASHLVKIVESRRTGGDAA